MRDALMIFSAAQSVTSGTSAISSNVLDLTPYAVAGGGYDVGTGGPVIWHLQVTTAPVGPTTVEIVLGSDSTTNLATSLSKHASTGAHLASGAMWAVGKVYNIPVPSTTAFEQYLGLSIVTTGSAFSAFTFSSWLDREVQWNRTPVTVTGMAFGS